jgi:hypothetical protein
MVVEDRVGVGTIQFGRFEVGGWVEVGKNLLGVFEVGGWVESTVGL